jgi:hypothetical protein
MYWPTVMWVVTLLCVNRGKLTETNLFTMKAVRSVDVWKGMHPGRNNSAPLICAEALNYAGYSAVSTSDTVTP